MKRFVGWVVLVTLALGLRTADPAFSAEADPALIARVTGLKTETVDGVVRVSLPRGELGVTVDGVKLEPFQGLTSWAAFQAAADEVIVMGDLVLGEDEVNPAMSAALENGLEVTALHNHFFFDRPRVFFMHIGGRGNAEALATGVRKALDAAAAEPRGVGGSGRASAEGFGGETVASQNKIDSKPLEKILGPSAQVKDGMVKFVFGRSASMHGVEIGSAMGVNTWAVFAGSTSAAVVDGDFAMLEDDLQAVLKALRRRGLYIVAIHNHMTHETPRVVFLHFWGKGDSEQLARSVKQGLDAQKR